MKNLTPERRQRFIEQHKVRIEHDGHKWRATIMGYDECGRIEGWRNSKYYAYGSTWTKCVDEAYGRVQAEPESFKP